MVNVRVREQQRAHAESALFQPCERGLRSVNEDAVRGQKEAVRVENAAGVGFDLHERERPSRCTPGVSSARITL